MSSNNDKLISLLEDQARDHAELRQDVKHILERITRIETITGYYEDEFSLLNKRVDPLVRGYHFLQVLVVILSLSGTAYALVKGIQQSSSQNHAEQERTR